MQRFGYNIDAGAIRDKGLLLAHLARIRPTVILVMDGLSLADEIYRLLDGETLVVHRSWSNLEGNEWKSRSPEQFVQQWRNEGHSHIIRYASANEPQFGELGSPQREQMIKAFVAHGVKLMRLAREAGFTVAFGNFSVGSFEKHEVDAGWFDPMLNAYEEYRQLAATHEYTTGLLPLGVGKWPAETLLNRDAVQFAFWPKASSLPTARKADGSLPDYWHLRRFDWMLLRSDTIGAARPAVLVLEGLWDYMGDIENVLAQLRQAGRAMGQFGDVFRGLLTYQELWAWYFPDLSFAEVIIDQVDWADSIYPKEYIGITFFGWNSRWYNQKEKEGHDWSAPELQGFRERFEDWAATDGRLPDLPGIPSFQIPPLSHRGWLWTKLKSNHAGKTRIRSNPTTKVENTVAWIETSFKNAKVNPEMAVTNEGLRWLPVQMDGKFGWAADQYFDIHAERTPLYLICN